MAAVKLFGPFGNHCFMLCCFFLDAKAARVCHAKVTTKFTRMGFLITTGLVGSRLVFLGVFVVVCQAVPMVSTNGLANGSLE